MAYFDSSAESTDKVQRWCVNLEMDRTLAVVLKARTYVLIEASATVNV